MNLEKLPRTFPEIPESVVLGLQRGNPQVRGVLPVVRAMLYQEKDPHSPMLFGWRPMSSKNHRGMAEALGGKREKTNGCYEPSIDRAFTEVSEETSLPREAFTLASFETREHHYVIDDPMSAFNGYLVWTVMHLLALKNPADAQQIVLPEHSASIWLTAAEALEAWKIGRLNLHPQTRFALPWVVQRTR